MQRPVRIARAHALALPRPQIAAPVEWLVAAVAAALMLAAALGR